MSYRKPSGSGKSGAVTGRARTALVVFALLVAGAIAAVLFMQPDQPPAAGGQDAVTATDATPSFQTNPAPPAPVSAAVSGNSKLRPLMGRWLRPDGNYVMVIDRIEPNGEMRAGYFNPRPIKVSRAEAFEKEGKTKMFLELRDEGYPGSYYDLEYSPTNDGLAGKYFQATMRETYEVEFVRMK